MSDKNLEAITDALECFWNASIGAARDSQDSTAIAVAGSLSEGFAAIARRLREHATTTEATSVVSDNAVAVVRKEGFGPYSIDMLEVENWSILPNGTKLYTKPSAAVPDGYRLIGFVHPAYLDGNALAMEVSPIRLSNQQVEVFIRTDAPSDGGVSDKN